MNTIRNVVSLLSHPKPQSERRFGLQLTLSYGKTNRKTREALERKQRAGYGGRAATLQVCFDKCFPGFQGSFPRELATKEKVRSLPPSAVCDWTALRDQPWIFNGTLADSRSALSTNAAVKIRSNANA